jgi:hypothetical protein
MYPEQSGTDFQVKVCQIGGDGFISVIRRSFSCLSIFGILRALSLATYTEDEFQLGLSLYLSIEAYSV